MWNFRNSTVWLLALAGTVSPVWAQDATEGGVVYHELPEEVAARAERHIERAQDLIKVGDTKGAILDLDEAVRIDPENAKAYFFRGAAQMKQENTDGAILDFSKAIEKDDRYSDAYLARSKAYENKDDWVAAMDDISKAIEVSPGNILYHGERAGMRIRRGDYEGAIEDYNRLLDITRQGTKEVNPSHVLALRGQAKYFSGDEEAAMADLDRAIRYRETSPSAYTARAEIKLANGLNKSALSDYNRAVNLAPGEAEPYFDRGLFYYAQGDYEKARKDIQMGRDQIHEPGDARDYSALWYWMIRAQEGERESASKWLATQVSKRPTIKLGDWYEDISRYLTGTIDEDTFLEATVHDDPIREREKKCEAYFYVAQSRLADHKPEEVVLWLKLCLNEGVVSFYEHKIARAQLARLGEGDE